MLWGTSLPSKQLECVGWLAGAHLCHRHPGIHGLRQWHQDPWHVEGAETAADPTSTQVTTPLPPLPPLITNTPTREPNPLCTLPPGYCLAILCSTPDDTQVTVLVISLQGTQPLSVLYTPFRCGTLFCSGSAGTHSSGSTVERLIGPLESPQGDILVLPVSDTDPPTVFLHLLQPSGITPANTALSRESAFPSQAAPTS